MKKLELKNKYNIGLVLSGGAARGFAHLGILKALHEHNISPEIISSVSAGAIVGAFYADGFSPEEILYIFEEKKLLQFTSLSFKRAGLLDISGLKKILNEQLRAKTFADLQKPLYIAVTNYHSGTVEYLYKGDLAESIVASSSIPVLFHPTEINKKKYIDGGVTDNFPVAPIQNQAKILIGVHANPMGWTDKVNGLLQVAIRSFLLSVNSKIDLKKNDVDIFICPQKLAQYGVLDVSKGREIFNIGYEEANKQLHQNKSIIQNYAVTKKKNKKRPLNLFRQK